MVISGKYEVIGILGQGGMGMVYQVRHTELRTLLAVKVLPPNAAEYQGFVDRFREEALKNYQLSNFNKRHPNIVQVLDVDFDPKLNFHYYVMEHIQGRTLGQCLQERGPFPLDRALAIALKVGEVLAYAHNQPRPVIHRDISPSNVMIEDRSERVVVMDFGIAKELGGKDRTKTGVVIGKPKYCSPEQMKHEPLSGASDVYALGMVVYEIYTGQQFFAGLRAEEVVHKLLYDEAENIPLFPPETLPQFVTLVTKAIAKSRAHRYQRMEEFLDDVQRCREALELTPVTMLLPSHDKREPNEDRRRRLEEEQRQMTVGLQAKVREARERAEQAGAAEWADLLQLLQQGRAREREGEKRLEERNYPLAQDAYEEAARVFLRAEEGANEAARQEAEQARTEMETAKADAERYQGQEKARRFYATGLSLAQEALQLWEHRRFRQAKELYEKAHGSFADAREFAYFTLQGEAEAERQRAEEAKTAAQTAGAAEMALDLFEQARRNEELGATALAGEQFLQASQWYGTARQQYEAAQQHVRLERQRQQVQTIRQQTVEAQQRVTDRGIEPESLPSYEPAAAAQLQGDTQFAAQEYEAAAQTYELARQGFARAAEEAETTLRQRAAIARQNLHEARRQASEAGAQARFAEEWRQTERGGEQGQAYEEQQDFAQALRCYVQAQQQFAALRQAAEEAALREQVEIARQQIEQSREQARPLQPWAETVWTRAQEQTDQAEQAYQIQHYQEAFTTYRLALELYAQVEKEGEQNKQEQELLQVRQQATEARDLAAAAQANQYAAERFARGLTLCTEAEQRETGRELIAAAQAYRQAQALFAAAAEEARQEFARQEGVTARLRLEEERSATEQTAVAQRLETEILQLQEIFAQGREYEEQKDFSRAANLYNQARQSLLQLRREAEQQSVRERAEEARRRAAELKQETEPLQAWARTQWAEAQQREAGAEQFWQGQDYEQAVEEYEGACRGYEKVRTEAEEERARQQAVAARSQMEQAQREVEQRAGQQYAADLYQQAMAAKQRGEQRLAEQQWEQAEEELWRARALFVQALQKSHQEQTRQTAAAVRETALQAQQEAVSWARLCPERFTEASTCFAQASRMFAREEFYDALAGFERSVDLFRQVQQEAALQRQKEQTEEMQARARKLQQEFRATKSRQKKQADQALAEGDQLFQQGKYRGAWEEYQDAVAQFAALQQEQTSRREFLPNTRKSPAPPPSRSFNVRVFLEFISQWKIGLSLLAGLGVLVVAGTYLLDPSGPSDLSGPGVSQPQKPTPDKNPSSSPSSSLAKKDQEPVAVPPVESVPQPATPSSPSPTLAQPSSDSQEQKPSVSPPPPPPLQITQATPEARELTVTEGQPLAFAVEAEGGQGEPLQYAWLLDGQAKATGKNWTYQPEATEGGDTPKQVTAEVTDEANQRVEKIWQVLVTKQVPGPNKPPRIMSVSPYADPIEISPGESTNFSVTAKDPDRDDRLVYVWTLNGQEVARGDDQRRFRAPPSASPYKVTVTVVDQAGKTDQMDWRVTIKAPSSGPRLIPLQPRENRVSTRAGQPLDFSVTAELSGGVQKQLRYQWNVEGTPTTTTETGSFRFIRNIPGIYRLTVFVVDSGGLQSPPKRWIVEVQP